MIRATVLLLSLPLLSQTFVDLPIRPDDRLTPGVIAETDVSKVCVIGYSKRHRHTSGTLKALVYRKYGLTSKLCGHCEVDHRIPLSLGGADVLGNLWPESYNISEGANAKDALERRIHELVCDEHSLSLEDGQRIFMNDWIAAYHQYLGKFEWEQ